MSKKIRVEAETFFSQTETPIKKSENNSNGGSRWIHYAPSNLTGDFPPIGRGQSALFKYSAASSRGPIKTHFADWVIKLQSTA